jgi:hypothetical protein
LKIIFFLIAYWILFGCNLIAKKGKQKEHINIRCIAISNPFPIIGDKGKVVEYQPFDTKIYYYQDQIMYQVYRPYTITNGKDGTSERYYPYYSFVFSKGKKQGIFYDSIRLISNKIVSVDSMLAKEWAYDIKYEEMFNDNTTGLISSRQSIDENELQELYWFKNKKDTTSTGTLQLTFSKTKLKGIDFSISKILDSLKKMKVIKAITTYNARFVKEYNYNIDTIRNVYIVEEIPVTNPLEIIKFFKKEREVIL